MNWYLRLILIFLLLNVMLFENNVFAKGLGNQSSFNNQSNIDHLVKEILKNDSQLLVKYKQPSYSAFTTNFTNEKKRLEKIKIKNPSRVKELVTQYLDNPNIEYVVPNYTREASFLPNDPMLADQWALGVLDLQEAWNIEFPNEVIVAVIDTGIDQTHEDLIGKVLKGYNFVKKNDDAFDDSLNSHGTKCAGIISAVSNNGIGIAGIAPNVKVMPIKVLDSQGRGYDSDIIDGINYAVDHGANIINLSLGGNSFSQALWDAVKSADSKGVTVIAAAGNQSSSINYPAAFPEVMSVGAIDNQKNIAWFSNFGKELDVVAPGVKILSTSKTNLYSIDSGTSFSAPIVSGIAALLKGKNSLLSPRKIKWILEDSATDGGDFGWDSHYGYGVVNPLAALSHSSLFEAEEKNLLPVTMERDNPYKATFQYPNETDNFTFTAKKGEHLKIDFSMLDSHINPVLKVQNIENGDSIIQKGNQGIVNLDFTSPDGGQYNLFVFDENGHWSKMEYQIEITQPIEKVYGDFNNDSRIDLFDIVALSKNLGTNEIKDLKFDSNEDELINLFDLRQLFNNYHLKHN